MVVLFRPYGDHSNRLFQNLHLQAFCLKNAIPYANPALNSMTRYYRGRRKRLRNLYLFYKIANKLKWFPYYEFTEKEDLEKYRQILKKKGINLVGGRDFTCDVLIEDQKEFLRREFLLKPKFYLKNPTWLQMESLDKDSTSVIGIHIRRGDYKDFLGGKYYYSIDLYQNIIDQMRIECLKKLNKKALFILFSNEKLLFDHSDDILVSRNEWYIDQHLMSQCDFIAGPPSTFSAWASFMGDVGLKFIEDNQYSVDLDDFAVHRGNGFFNLER